MQFLICSMYMIQARELLQPHLGTNGYYILRPSSERKGGVICTICVTYVIINVHVPLLLKCYIIL